MTSTIDLCPPDTADPSQIWPYIRAQVIRLMDSPEKISPSEHMALWVTIHDLVAMSRPSALDLHAKLKEIFIERVKPIAKEISKMLGVELLRSYLREFHRYKAVIERVDRAFAFYNRRWAEVGEAPLLPVYLLALTQWKENCVMVIQRDDKKVTNAILHLIREERNGEIVDEDLLKNVIASFISLDLDRAIYQEVFETSFLREPMDDFKADFERIFQSEQFVRDYLNKLEYRLLHEQRRAEHYIPKETHEKFIRTMVIDSHCEELANKLLENREDEELGRMYTLLSRIKPDGLEPLKKSFKAYVEKAGLLPKPTKSGRGRGNKLDIQQRHAEIVDKCFQGDPTFATLLPVSVGGPEPSSSFNINVDNHLTPTFTESCGDDRDPKSNDSDFFGDIPNHGNHFTSSWGFSY